MSTKQRMSLAYLMYILGVFILPCALIALYYSYKERKDQPKQWLKTHCAYLIKSIYLNLLWIAITILVIWLAALVGYKTFMVFFILSIISLVWIWIFALYQYFHLSWAFVAEQAVDMKYYEEMWQLAQRQGRWVWHKYCCRRTKKL